MNKIVASVGVVALGASGLQAVSAADLAEGSKPWSLSASLRGFYDDNINTINSSTPLPPGDSRSSLGFSVSPGANLTWAVPQTSISAGYVYEFIYYENKPEGNTEHYDQDQTFNLSVNHAFSERYQIAVLDSFVIGQEPDQLRAGNSFTSYQRVPGSNIRNFGSINFTAVVTPLLSLQAGYANGYYDYADHGAELINTIPPSISASLAGLLNRLENTFHIDSKWQWMPETVAILGYQFSSTSYTADEAIGLNFSGIGPEVLYSDSRNNRSQYGYVGVDHTFRPDLTGSVRAGARYNDYYNDPTSQNGISPYAMASLRYAYMPESYVEGGFSYDRTATDLFSVNQTTGSITTDANAFNFWVSLTHRIMPKLYGTLMLQLQDATYNGGELNGEDDLFFTLGLNLQYRFSQYFSAEVGYNFDDLDSSSGVNSFSVATTGQQRSYTRNRVYLGVTATY